jgi:hypothetical protein
MNSSETSSLDYEWRLPTLSGAVLLGYRAIWLVLFAAALLSTFYFSVRNEVTLQARYEAAATLGISPFLDVSTDGQFVGPLGDEGRRIGFGYGDLLLTVDGRALPTDLDAQARLLAGPAGSRANLLLRRPTGELHSVEVARDPQRLDAAYAGWGITFQSRRWVQFIFESAVPIAAIMAAVLLFLRRPRDPVAQLLSFSLVLPAATVFNFGIVGPILGAVLQAISTVVFIVALLLFPDGRLNTRWHWLALLLFVAAEAGAITLTARGALTTLAAPLFAAAFAAIMAAVIVQYRRTPAGDARQQMKFVLFGIAVGSMFIIVAQFLVLALRLPSSAGALGWLTLATHLASALGLIAIFAGLLVSMLRFRLYDAESAISRSVAYGALTLFLLAIFAGSEKVIEILGEEYFGEHLRALAGGLGAAIAAVMVAPLHHRVTHWAEHRFQGDLLRLRQGLPQLVGDMRETATPERLADAALARIERGVRASHGAIVVAKEVLDARDVDPGSVRDWMASWSEPAENVRHLQVDREDQLFPLRLPLYAEGMGMVGWLLLGPRPDGSFYGKDERETLLAIADPIARALTIARERQRNFGGLSAKLSLIEGWLEELRARMAKFEAGTT